MWSLFLLAGAQRETGYRRLGDTRVYEASGDGRYSADPEFRDAELRDGRGLLKVPDFPATRPATFFQSTVAVNPLGPGLLSHLTLILRPSINMTTQQTGLKSYYVNVYLPGFTPSAPRARDKEACEFYFGADDYKDGDSLGLCEKNLNAMHRIITMEPYPHPAFNSFAYFNTEEGPLQNTLTFSIKALRTNAETEAIFCCFLLPIENPANNPVLQVEALSTPGDISEVPRQPIKQSPEIVRGNYWKHLQLQFDPPTSLSIMKITTIIESAQDITDQARIIIHLPGISRISGESGDLAFNTVGSDWLLFEYFGYWNVTSSSMSFFLREGAVLEQGRKVSIRTLPNEFRLPIELAANDPEFKVEARSADNVDELIEATSVFQSDRVAHVRAFVTSYLEYDYGEELEDGVTVVFGFRSNRPMYAGTAIYLKLPGFGTPITQVPLKGDIAPFFYQREAVFDIPNNLATLTLNTTLYSDEELVVVKLLRMTLPPALYENDESLQVSTSDENAEPQAIQKSPKVGEVDKHFEVSEVLIDPPAAEVVANIGLLIKPSVDFYQGNHILLHLHGFECPKQWVELSGPDAQRFGTYAHPTTAHWREETGTLTLQVSEQQMVSRMTITNVTIMKDQGCMSPSKLSKDDGILTIESKGAVINKEGIKRCPAIGSRKFITDSQLFFEPADSNAFTKMIFSFIANADILPNSTIYYKLGGLQRVLPAGSGRRLQDPSGLVQLSGINAPLFVDSMGLWDNERGVLSTTVIPTVKISAGKVTEFFLERDQNFKLPYAMYAKDPSLKISCPAAGIKEQNFNYTSRVNKEGKAFTVSRLNYGEVGQKPYPGRPAHLRFQIKPNVALREGTVIRLTLPGFRCPACDFNDCKVALNPLPSNLYDETYTHFLKVNGSTPYATWDPKTQQLDFVVAPGFVVENGKVTSIFLNEEEAMFKLPDRLDENDESLTIESLYGQIIFTEPIKESSQVVDRQFDVSRFTYTPRTKQSTFMFRLELMPTVTITWDNPIIITLPGFTNVLDMHEPPYTHIHMTGRDGHRVELPPANRFAQDAQGIEAASQWDGFRAELMIWPQQANPFLAFELIDLIVEESQGFILPEKLLENDNTLRIESLDNILPDKVKQSPLVGDEPRQAQRYCMRQYEKGVRTRDSTCRVPDCASKPDDSSAAGCCWPPLVDPCSPRELERCSCPPVEDTPAAMVITGFQIYSQDFVAAIPLEMPCTEDFERHQNPGFMIRNPDSTVTEDREELTFQPGDVTSSVTGFFRLCMRHFEAVYDIGHISVRPSCNPSSLVMVEGICVEHCPTTKKPVAGDCVNDIVAKQPLDDLPILISIKMNKKTFDDNAIYKKNWNDPEREQFTYAFTRNMAETLNAAMDRFSIASISNGSVIVNVILVPTSDTTDEEDARRLSGRRLSGRRLSEGGSPTRSPSGLLSLLRALQADEMSQIYSNPFLQTIERDYRPAPVAVQLCEDGDYRVVCPFSVVGVMSPGMAAALLGVATIMLLIVLSVLCLCAWRFDTESKGQDMSLAGQDGDGLALDPSMQAEFARSWLESRPMKTMDAVKRDAVKHGY